MELAHKSSHHYRFTAAAASEGRHQANISSARLSLCQSARFQCVLWAIVQECSYSRTIRAIRRSVFCIRRQRQSRKQRHGRSQLVRTRVVCVCAALSALPPIPSKSFYAICNEQSLPHAVPILCRIGRMKTAGWKTNNERLRKKREISSATISSSLKHFDVFFCTKAERGGENTNRTRVNNCPLKPSVISIVVFTAFCSAVRIRSGIWRLYAPNHPSTSK